MIDRGSCAFLEASNSVFTVEYNDRCIHVSQMAGRMDDVPEIIECLKALAIDMNKEYVSLRGRAGWTRVLKPYGFKLNNEVLECRLA